MPAALPDNEKRHIEWTVRLNEREKAAADLYKHLREQELNPPQSADGRRMARNVEIQLRAEVRESFMAKVYGYLAKHAANNGPRT